MPRSAHAKEEMIKECNKYYRDKPRQLAQVTEFQRTYTREKAIRWYTRPCFLYRLINKALRTEDIAALWTFRYFISDLCASLAQARMTIVEPLRLYRGTKMTRSEIQLLSVGSLVSTNGFFSTSRHSEIAEMFIAQSTCENDQDQYVLFEIDILPNSSEVILADVAVQSQVPDEAEVLFDLGAMFEIVSIKEDTNHFVRRIQLRPSTEVQIVKQDYERFICSQMEYTSPAILVGMLFADMSEYTKSLTYFRGLLRTLSPRHKDLPNTYYGLARACRFIGRHRIALALMRRAERLQCRMLPLANFDYARTLASLATVYAEMNDYQQELFYYKKAYALYQRILPSRRHIEIARSLSRLGLAYIHQHQYLRAVSILKKSLKVYDQTTPENHPYKADALEVLGNAYKALDNMKDCLNLNQKALSMRCSCLPQNHPKIDHSYSVLTELYENCGEYRLALKFSEESLKLRERKFPKDHVSVQEARNLVEKLSNRFNQL